MKKSEMFSILVDKVCEVCEVSKESLLNGSKIQAVVDARILAVQYLRRVGLTPDDISLIVLRNGSEEPTLSDIKKRARAVNKMFDSYSQRCLDSYAFCLMSEEIKRFCREKYKEYYLSWMKELPPLK